MNEEPEALIERSAILPVFPTFVWKLQLRRSLSDRINRDLLAKLAAARNTISAGQAWQSEQNWHALPELAGPVAAVERSAAGVLRFLHVAHTGFEITGCWVSVNAKGAAHRVHTHPNNFLSCVYYVQAQPGADTINFHDPRIQTSIMRPRVTQLTGENTDQAVVQVRNGTLLLFPAWLPHSVDANSSDQSRISVSCNIMFRGYTETMSKPLWTGKRIGWMGGCDRRSRPIKRGTIRSLQVRIQHRTRDPGWRAVVGGNQHGCTIHPPVRAA